MSDELAQIEKLANAMLARVSAGQRRTLLRKIARTVQGSQRERIRSQRDPEGAPYVPRRPKAPPRPGNHALRFLYPKGAAEPRLVFMKSWVHQGALVTGFDIEANAIRSFFWDRIAKYLPVPAEDDNVEAGRLRRKGVIRKKAMFRKISSARYLRAGIEGDEAWVGFSGLASDIARVHQDGLKDKPAPKAKAVLYPRRPLLGLTAADREAVLNMLLEHVSAV
ncbi:phage virion morphogenesis protein [Sphingomonas oryzagri]|uniref:Phage virion morphogenesis protein n=1 Tax=Sphingomonas oryzagri TaxID=3042314 RepID=A0ABT6N7R3_9SPHN|nr:phage virion morphogenesis protein [Sphingomonas oryzagri]MDH7641143.1 phage virion morphogenesis protein [Sphingomonas oryzagri]